MAHAPIQVDVCAFFKQAEFANVIRIRYRWLGCAHGVDLMTVPHTAHGLLRRQNQGLVH